MSSTNSQPNLDVQSNPAAVEHDYFAINEPPALLEAHTAAAKSFIEFHAAAKRRVVLVTSGGTTVPLEKNTVRFIDNFSAGTRGATSAENFLDNGYAVIFLHRQFSLLPYSRHYSHATDCFLDFLQEDNGSVVANKEHQEKMLQVLREYTEAKKHNLLLTLPFTTITDYLFVLRSVSQLLRPLGPHGLLYLAAAVSDFWIPPDRLAEHKIQSSDVAEQKKNGDEETFDNFDSTPRVPRSKSLIINLDPVPKFLTNLVDGWAPESMVVSFKLETDPNILIHKAQTSLDRYQHHLVIGNLLTTRKWEVVFVSRDSKTREIKKKWIRVPRHRRKKSFSGVESMVGAAANEEDQPLDPQSLPDGEPELEIESLIIPAVEELHDKHIENYDGKKSSW